MDIIDELRKQARERRNAALALARAEYRQTLEQIEQVRRGLGVGYKRVSRSKSKPLQDLICDLIPLDRTFNINELVVMMRTRFPLRKFNVPTIRTIVPRLGEQGIIRKVGRDEKGCVLWASVHAKVEASAFAAMPLTEVAEMLLRERGPMRLTELVVTMQQAGFRRGAEPRQLMQSLRWANKRYPGRFEVGEDGCWKFAQ
jgi:hypothetical protein